MFVYRGQNVDGITQGFSKGDPRDILKDMTGGLGPGKSKFQEEAKEIGQSGKK